MRNNLHDSNPGDKLDTAMKDGEKRTPVETLKDFHGLVVEVYGYGGGGGEEAYADTNHGKISMHRIEGLRKLAILDASQSEGMDEGDLRQLAIRIDRDPGASAREKVLTRGQKVKRAMVRTYILIITAVVLLVAGAAGYVYYEFTKPGKRMVDYRVCSFTDEKSGLEITGRRENSYLERSLFGIHYRLDKDLEQKTQIDIKGDAITVVGMNADGSYWSKFADMGERGIMILSPADQYVFATKKKGVPVGYDQFCH